MGCLNPAEGLHVIQLREIPPPYPMLAEPFDLSQMKKELPTKASDKQEYYSTPDVTPKPFVKPPTEKGKLIIFSTPTSPRVMCTNTYKYPLIRDYKGENREKTLKNNLFHKNTHNLSYISYKNPKLLLQKPTEPRNVLIGMRLN
jgi:hypothetical protein